MPTVAKRLFLGVLDTSGDNYDNSGAFSVSATGDFVPQPNLFNVVRSGTNLTISFQTITGIDYTLEYKNDLNQPTWIPIATVNGNGTVRMLTDPSTKAPQRFYHVRVD